MRASTRPTLWSAEITALTALIVIAAWTVLVSRWMLDDVVVPWDSKNHFYAMLRYLAQSIQDGEIPLWNPYHFSGFPTVADPQSLLFIPTMLAFAALVSDPTLKMFDFVIFLHLLMAMLGVMFYARFKGWHPVGAGIAALVFAFGGSAAMRLQHTGMIISYSFFPLALLFLEVALERKSYRAGVAFAVFAAFMALGRDQVAFMLCAVLIAMALVKIATAERPFHFLRSRALMFIMMGIIGGAILAVPALLTLQLLTASNRPDISYGYAIKGSLYPANLVTLLAPDFFGALSDMFNYRGPSWQTTAGENLTDASINQIFIGTVPILFVLWHGFAGRRAFEGPARFFTILLIVALFYAFGRYTPVFEWVFDWLPGVNLYRRPADATFIINVALAFLSGYLVHRFLEDGAPKLGRAAVSLIGLAVAAVFAFALWFLEEHSKVMASGIETVIALALFAMGGLVLSARLPAQGRAVLASALLALTVTEIGWRSAACSLNAEPKAYYAFLETPRPADEKFLDALDDDIARRQSMGQRPRVEMVGLPGPWMNSPMVYGLESTVGYNPLRLDNYQRAVGPGENAADLSLRLFPSTFRGYRSRLARLLGIEYVAFDRPVNKLPKHFPKLSADPFFIADHLYVYRLPPAAPRAYLATRVQTVDSAALLLKGEIPDFNVPEVALVDDATVPRRVYAGTDAPAKRAVEITDYRANQVTLDVESEVPATLVLHDIYYPGWVVEVDGMRQPVLRANLLFRGVEVPAGKHSVVFTFKPLSLENLRMAVNRVVQPDSAEALPEDDDLPLPAETPLPALNRGVAQR